MKINSVIIVIVGAIILSVIFYRFFMPKYRLLTKEDIGKVFIAKGIEPHPNFGKYKILISVESKDLYAFDTFDIVDGKPVGKLVVSHAALPIYREIKMEPEFLETAKDACEQRMAKERNDLQTSIKQQQIQEERIKKKYNIPGNYVLLSLKKLKNNKYSYAVWINPQESEFRIQLYSETAILAEESLKWIHEPIYGMDKEDAKKIYGILDKMLKTAKITN